MKTTEFLKENSIIAQEADTMHKDHEVQMARSQMYNSANAAIEIHKLLKNISEMEGIEGWVASKLTLANQYLESVRDYLKYEQVSQEPEMMEFVSEAADYALKKLVENSDAVHSAITRRIANQHPELLQAYGPEIVGAAIDDVANWIGDVDEIGSSDVSGWVRQVAQMLEENPPEAFMKEARDGDTNFGSTVGHGSWVVYDGSKVKRFKSRDGAKAYAAKNGGKVASSEFYADNIQKQGVSEAQQCPECGGAAYDNEMIAEEKDACYSKVKSRYKVWPSAYASGALVKCRKVGAKNWGNKSKKK